MSRVALFLNGQTPKRFPDFKQFAAIYCTDGSYSYLAKNKIVPDVVSGDFDSIDENIFPENIEIIETPDQNFTDFEKALQIIIQRKFTEVYVYGGSGMEHDHFLGNLTTGLKYKRKINLVFFDDYSCYFFSEKETILEGYRNRVISLYPFPKAKGISTTGLKYVLENEDLDQQKRVGIRNEGISDKIIITYKSGELLLFIKN